MADAGMADILSPFLLVFPQDDALAFMCFAAFMGQLRQNFLEGQPGVHSSIQHIGSLLQHADPKLWRQIGEPPPPPWVKNVWSVIGSGQPSIILGFSLN